MVANHHLLIIISVISFIIGRDQKTQKNRRLRAAVREGGHVSKLVKEVTRLQCEQALVEIQMIHGE